MTALTWSHHRIGPLAPCRLCHRPALLRDDRGRPCHKVCAEAALNHVEDDQADTTTTLLRLPVASPGASRDRAA